MELDWIETFLAVADRGGFTAASAQVHRSQSRVSAHIAALERELGMPLIDRTRRPATLTPAGQTFAVHAREILADVSSARSAIGLLRSMEQESLSVLTTLCIGGTFFPPIIASLLKRHPRARISMSEHGRQDGARGNTADGFVLAVLPTLSRPQPAGIQERPLWRERLHAVVPSDHELAGPGGSRSVISPDQLAGHPLVIAGMSMNAVPEIVAILAARGLETDLRCSVDSSRALVDMVRCGVGIGIGNAVGLRSIDTEGVAVLDVDDPDMMREVSAYWYDELLSTDVGRSLHWRVFHAPLPIGAVPMGAGAG